MSILTNVIVGAGVVLLCICGILWFGYRQRKAGEDIERGRQAEDSLDTAVAANKARQDAARGNHDEDVFNRDRK